MCTVPSKSTCELGKEDDRRVYKLTNREGCHWALEFDNISELTLVEEKSFFSVLTTLSDCWVTNQAIVAFQAKSDGDDFDEEQGVIVNLANKEIDLDKDKNCTDN